MGVDRLPGACPRTMAAVERRVDRSRILVVDDDPTIAEVVARYLERDGYEVETSPDGFAALRQAEEKAPDLVVLDLMLPVLDGFEVFRLMRARSSIPVVMLTARGQEDDRVAGLELGADDYLSKPFSPRELTARVKAVLRRTQTSSSLEGAAEEPLTAEGIEVDVRSRDVRVGGLPVMLTALEFDLLVFLMRHSRQVFRREELLEHVWGYTFGDTSTVTVHVRRLREKIESDPANPMHLKTVWGVGYRFER